MDFNATIIGQILSFILFVFFCMKYIWPSIISKIKIREEEIKNALLFSKKTKEELKIYKEKTENEIQIIKQNASNIINSAMQKKIKILKSARLEANNEKKIILEQAQLDIMIEYQKARDELRKKVSYIAIKIAKKIINNSIHVTKKSDTISSLIKKI